MRDLDRPPHAPHLAEKDIRHRSALRLAAGAGESDRLVGGEPLLQGSELAGEAVEARLEARDLVVFGREGGCGRGGERGEDQGAEAQTLIWHVFFLVVAAGSVPRRPRSGMREVVDE